MTTFRIALARLGGLLTGRRDRARLLAEIRTHIDLLTRDHIAAGMAPADARRAAIRAFGSVAQVQEAYLDEQRLPFLDHVIRDVRHGLRALGRNPGFTLAAVLTLALGIGANAVIFTLVNALLFRPLPVRDANRLTVFARELGSGDVTTTFSFAEFDAIRTQASHWSDVVAVRPATLALMADGRTDRIQVSFVSENYFDALGLQPAAGTFFPTTDPAARTAEPVVVLGYDFWSRRFGGDPSAVGKSVSIGGSPVTIVGVGPRGFTGDSMLQDISGFLPLHAAGFPMMSRMALRVLGDLKRPATLTEANASLAGLSNRFAEARHEDLDHVRLTAFWERYTRPRPQTLRPEVAMTIFFGVMAALVLGLACVNVTNLILIRTMARRPEIALRSALGATRGRIALHLFIEALMLVAVAGGVGLVVGAWATRGLGAALPSILSPFAGQLGWSFDWRVAAFAAGAIAVTTLIVGTAPAIVAARRSTQVLGGVTPTATTGRTKLRRVLMGAQVAGALVLLVIAGLFARGLAATRARSFGFDARGVYDFSLNPAESGYNNPRAEELAEAIRARVQALPGVTAAALSQSVPMTGMYSEAAVVSDAPASPAAAMYDQIGYSAISPTYFDTLRIPLRSGRAFSSTDTAGSVRVAVVTAVMADLYWPQGSAIGRTFRFGGASSTPVQVVGIVGDVKNYGAMQDHESPFFYLPISQHPTPSLTLQVRSSAPPPVVFSSVNAQFHGVAPDIIPYDVQTMTEAIDNAPDGLFLFKLGAGLSTALGVLGLALAVVGVFGVVAYGASQRTREMAVRMALGATADDIRRDVLSGGAVVIGGGVIAGSVVAASLAVLTQSLYADVSPLDPTTYIGAIVIVGVAALLACYLPARRAMRTDPIAALRAE